MAYYAASIDDNDPAFIYSDGWQLVTEDGDWRGTMHSTSVPGSYARVRFTGSRVAGVFTIPTGDGESISATFSIDNGPAVTRSRATTGPVQWNYLLFDSGPLPYGNHLLIITDVAKSGYLRLDRIDYDPTPKSAPSSAPPAVSKSTPVQAPPTTVIVTSPPNNNSPPATLPASSNPGATGSSSHAAAAWTQPANTNPSSTPLSVPASVPMSQPASTPTSPIDANAAQNTPAGSQSKSSGPSAGLIGGVLGAVVAILLILLAGIFIVRRRRKRTRSGTASSNGAGPDTPANTVPTPFDVSMSNASGAQLVSRGHFTSPSASGTDFSSPTSDMYTSGQPSTSVYASLSTHQRPDVAFDSTMMASSKHAEHLQEAQTSTSPSASSGYATYGANTQRLSTFAEYVPPPAYQ